MTESSERIGIHFGALAPPFIQQLNEQGYTLDEKDNKRIQECFTSLFMVYIHQLIPEYTYKEAQKRLMKEIVKCAKPL